MYPAEIIDELTHAKGVRKATLQVALARLAEMVPMTVRRIRTLTLGAVLAPLMFHVPVV